MGYTNTTEVTLHYNKELEVQVTYYYNFDKGVHTLCNGDPGYPDEYEFEIQEITDDNGNDMKPIFDRMDSIFKNVENYQSPYDYLNENITPEAPEDDFEPDIDDYCEFDHLIP